LIFDKIFGAIQKFETGFESAIRYLAITGAYALGIMMILATADVLGRYLFNSPVKGSYEIVGYILLMVVTWGLAYAQKQRMHIRATFILHKFPEKLQQTITILSNIAGLILFTLITWQTVLLFQRYLAEGRQDPSLHLAIAPFIILLIIGTTLFSIRLLLSVIHDLLLVFKTGLGANDAGPKEPIQGM